MTKSKLLLLPILGGALMAWSILASPVASAQPPEPHRGHVYLPDDGAIKVRVWFTLPSGEYKQFECKVAAQGQVGTWHDGGKHDKADVYMHFGRTVKYILANAWDNFDGTCPDPETLFKTEPHLYRVTGFQALRNPKSNYTYIVSRGVTSARTDDDRFIQHVSGELFALHGATHFWSNHCFDKPDAIFREAVIFVVTEARKVYSMRNDGSFHLEQGTAAEIAEHTTYEDRCLKSPTLTPVRPNTSMSLGTPARSSTATSSSGAR